MKVFLDFDDDDLNAEVSISSLDSSTKSVESCYLKI